MGSGFVVGDHLLMTANHVAEGGSAITVQYDGGVTTAQVLGLDPSTDSALLCTKDALPGAPLKLLNAVPGLGLDIGVQVFTPAKQRAMRSVADWSKGLSTSYWTDLAVNTVSVQGDRASADVTLVTNQDASDGHNGQTCSVWAMTYTMVGVDGAWLIDKAKAAPGSPTAC